MTEFEFRQQELLDRRNRGLRDSQSYEAPQGRMVGGHYIPPSFGDALVRGLRAYAGQREYDKAGQELKNLQAERSQLMAGEMKALTEALRGRPAEQLPEGMQGPAAPAVPGGMEAYYQRAIQSQVPEFQQMGLQGQLEQAKNMQAQAQRQQQMQAIAGMSPQQAIAAGMPVDLVKAYHEGRNIGRDEVTWQNVGDKLLPVTKYGDRPEGVNPAAVGMSPSERDASSRGWASVNQGQQRIALEQAAQAMNNQTAGKAPTGYRFTPDGNLQAIPGGPADIKAGELGDKREKSKQAAIAQADRVIGKVDQALSKVGVTTSGLGSSIAQIPGTTARDLQSDLETIKANLGFAELQAMRDASPTGGALGSVAVQELNALQSTVASLDQSQSPSQLRRSLSEIRGHYGRWKNAVEGKPAPGKGNTLPSDVQSLLNKYGG